MDVTYQEFLSLRKKQLRKFVDWEQNFTLKDDSYLTDDDIAYIKQIGFCKKDYLHFQNNQLTHKSVKILLECCPDAIQIDFSNSPIKDQAIQCFPHKSKNIYRLRLRNCGLTSRAMKLLSKSDFTCLNQITLNGNKLANKGCKWLSAAPWPSLQVIYLTNNGITDGGAIHLSKAKWAYLKTLFLMDNFITQQGVQHLKKGNWDKLKSLSVYNANFACCFRVIEFYPNIFTQNCIYSYRRLKKQSLMRANPRYPGFLIYE